MNIIDELHATHYYLPKAEEEGGVWTEYWPLPGSVSSTDAARLVSEELRDDKKGRLLRCREFSMSMVFKACHSEFYSSQFV